MAVIVPSSLLSGILTISSTDLVSGQQTAPVINRSNNPVLFKAVQVIYNGYVNLTVNSTTGTISPAPGTPSFSLLYVRNGGTTPCVLSWTRSDTITQSLYLDPGAIFYWETPQQLATALGVAFVSGINNFSIASGTTVPASNIEFLAAA